MSKKGTILVVDDVLISLELIETILKDEGYTVFTAESGEIALSTVEPIMPELILLDIRMDDMDGFEVCMRLKENQKTREIPVVFLSALFNTSDKVQGLKLGAVDFISKPFKKAELLARVQSHLQISQMRLQLEKQAKDLIDSNKKLELEIIRRKQIEERFNAFINADLDMIFMKDEKFRYLDVNDAMAKFFGKTKVEMLGKTDSQLSSEHLTFPCKSSDKKALESESAIVVEEQLGDRFCETTKFPLLLNDNKKGIGGIIRDITEKKKSDESLRKFIMGIENATDAIFITDVNGIIEYINPAFEKIYGYCISDINGQTPRILKSGLLSESFYVHFWKTLLEKTAVSGEIRNRTKDGRIITIEATNNPILDDKDEIIGFISINRDITERKKLIDEIQNEKKLLRTLIDIIPDAIYIKDELGRKLVTNPADLKVMNSLNEAEVLGKTDLEIHPGKIGKRGFDDDMDVIKNGHSIMQKEEFFQQPDGNQYWLLTSKIPIISDNGKITGLVGIGRDITEIKMADAAILKLSTALEQSPLSIVITNTEGIIEYTNPRLSQITGYSPNELIGQNPSIFKSGETSPEDYAELWETILSGKEWYGELQNRKKNGELFWESVSISPIRNENEEIFSYIAIKEDITNQKLLMKELIVSKEKAEESDRLKSAFLANMSHEIRTPLNGILGFSELLADPDFDQDQKAEMARLILDNGDQLLAIINDVLDISKIEAGQVEIHYTLFSANQLIKDIQKSFIHKSSITGVELRIDSNISTNEIQLKSDFMRVKQVLTNLVSNALKFTDKGFVEIGFLKTNTEFIFHVKDTGLGIPQEFQGKIFERFRHLEPNRSKVFGGNGLGLAISKSFIEMLGGRIWVESETGKGSCFYFTIPI